MEVKFGTTLEELPVPLILSEQKHFLLFLHMCDFEKQPNKTHYSHSIKVHSNSIQCS